jgi:chorismate mutase
MSAKPFINTLQQAGGRYYLQMKVRAIRGATQLQVDDLVEMAAAVTELLTEIFEQNQLSTEDLISIHFTSTTDLVSDFPAKAARSLELGLIPLICSTEISVPGALPRVIRVMVHAYSSRRHEEIVHIYRRGAEVLRRDLAQ